MEILYALIFGMALGFSLSVPPGPMNALIASESLASARRGVVTGMGAMSSDMVLGAIVYAIRSLLELGVYVRGIYLLGAVIVAWLGAGTLRNRMGKTVEPRDARTYARAFTVGITNPFQILWWLTAGLAFAYLGGPVLFVGLFLAIAVWIVAFPLVLHAGTHRSPKTAEAVRLVSASLMFLFAAYFALAAAGLV